jgi:hypothetical protein
VKAEFATRPSISSLILLIWRFGPHSPFPFIVIVGIEVEEHRDSMQEQNTKPLSSTPNLIVFNLDKVWYAVDWSTDSILQVCVRVSALLTWRDFPSRAHTYSN